MDTTVLVALVLTVTQVAKSWLQKWFPKLNWQAWMSVALSFLTSIGVVVYTSSEVGIPLTLESLWIVFGIFAIANGGKKLIGTLKPK